MSSVRNVFLAQGQELTPEAEVMLGRLVDSQIGPTRIQNGQGKRGQKRTLLGTFRFGDGPQIALAVDNIAPEVSTIIDVQTADRLPTVPIHWNRGDRRWDQTLGDFLHDLTSPRDAAGRELHLFLAQRLNPGRLSTHFFLPVLATVQTGLTLGMAVPGQHLDTLGAEAAIAGPVGALLWLAKTLRFYQARAEEIRLRQPDHMHRRVADSLKKAWAGRSSDADIDGVATQLGNEIARGLLEVNAHLESMHFRVVGKKTPILQVTTLVGSPVFGIEDYPLTFEIDLSDQSGHRPTL